MPCKEAYFWLDRTYDPDRHMFDFPQFQSRPTMLKFERSLRVALEIPYYSGLLPFLKFKFITFIQVFKFHSESLALLDPCLWLLIKLSHLFPRVVDSWRLEKNKIRTKGKTIIHPVRTLNSGQRIVNVWAPLGPHFPLSTGTPSAASSPQVWSDRMWELEGPNVSLLLFSIHSPMSLASLWFLIYWRSLLRLVRWKPDSNAARVCDSNSAVCMCLSDFRQKH